MRSGTIAFLAGIVCLQQLPALPAEGWAALLLPLPLALLHPWTRLPALVAAGFLWALLRADLILRDQLPASLEGQDLVLEGTIASLPEHRERAQRFEFEVQRVQHNGRDYPSPGRVRLNWYESPIPLHAGERWRLTVRLKRPWGFMNPGGFDYEGWLFQHRIRATGYVRTEGEATQLGGPHAVKGVVNRARQRLAEQIDAVLPSSPFVGMITALAIGQRDRITNTQWDVLRRTGTSHLMAISGLHIGLVAGLSFFGMRRLWARLGRLPLYVAAPKAAALAALCTATVYTALAGFAIPTQRALIMVAVVMLGILFQRRVPPSRLLAIALLAVLIYDPFAVMAAGFWLSYAAVGVILIAMTGRIATSGAWWRWGRLHVAIALGLVPLMAVIFQRISLVSPLANLIAVPWVSLTVVPLTLLGSAALGAGAADLGGGLISIAAAALHVVWVGLEWVSAWPIAEWTSHKPVSWTLLPAAAGVLVLLAPRGLPRRLLGVVLLLPLFIVKPPPPSEGTFEFTLLDVGQGLAAVVRTRNHALVFDTGPQYSSTFDSGAAVVVPFLRAQGIGRIDSLIISHGDNDHSGGAESILREISVERVLSGTPARFRELGAEPCRVGQEWDWDGVNFTVLYPREPGRHSGNNASCVLRVGSGKESVLLTGDIERRVERQLLREVPDALSAQVLVAPHHGSRSSSSLPFIRAVGPRFALFAVGYRNRYGFPKPDIVARYAGEGATPLDTALYGAITFRPKNTVEGLDTPLAFRDTARRYWHSR